ncbi:MAG TPA: hypothetical protein VGM52_12290 [Herbaspirillum sp.]
MSLKNSQVARFLLAVIGAAVVCIAANAADISKKEIESNYQRERASCLNGTSNQDRATCLKEAGAAREEARRGQLTDNRNAEQQNAVARCAVLPESDRADCARRVQGEGSASGSVREGGIFRETVTTVPATPDSRPMDKENSR